MSECRVIAFAVGSAMTALAVLLWVGAPVAVLYVGPRLTGTPPGLAGYCGALGITLAVAVPVAKLLGALNRRWIQLRPDTASHVGFVELKPMYDDRSRRRVSRLDLVMFTAVLIAWAMVGTWLVTSA